MQDDAGAYNLEMMPDTNSPGHTQWFYFKVSDGNKGQTVKFRILNFKKKKSLYKSGMRICYYSKKMFRKKEIGWVRGGENIQYRRNKDYLGSIGLDDATVKRNIKKYSLEFSFKFPYDRDEISFAFCFPYTYEDLLSHAHQLHLKFKKIKHV